MRFERTSRLPLLPLRGGSAPQPIENASCRLCGVRVARTLQCTSAHQRARHHSLFDWPLHTQTAPKATPRTLVVTEAVVQSAQLAVIV